MFDVCVAIDDDFAPEIELKTKVKSIKKSKKLLHAGYEFHLHSTNKNGTTTWRCANKTGCNGSITLGSDSGMILKQLDHICGNDPAQPPLRLPVEGINSAYKACKFGRFHFKLLFTVFIGCVAGVSVTSSTAYLLSSAECDLNMNLEQKGLLNGSPYLGMMLSSVLGGFLTDTFGRKLFILMGFGGIFICTVIAGSSQSYEVLIVTKFLEGLVFASSFSAVLSLTSEFYHRGIRDRVLLCQSAFAASAQILVPLMAWGILINEWKVELFGGAFVLHTWNFYLYIISLWSLTAFLLYSLVPESPKFLVSKGRYGEARKTLIHIYTTNTGKAADTYPYLDIWRDNEKELEHLSKKEVKATITRQLVAGLQEIKPMFRKPLLWYLALICLMNILMMCMYNIIRLWFPQLSTIVEHYRIDESHDLCTVLDTYTRDMRLKTLNKNSTGACVAIKTGSTTYINSIILGCVGLLPFFVTGILVSRVGKKSLFIAMNLICICTVFSLRWATSRAVIVALFASTTATANVMLSLNQALTMEVFPTSTRSLTIGLVMVCGRLGTLSGNLAFPWLLEVSCILPFFGMTGMMIVVLCLGYYAPVKKRKKKKKSRTLET